MGHSSPPTASHTMSSIIWCFLWIFLALGPWQPAMASLSLCTTGSTPENYMTLTQQWLLPWQRRLKTIGASDSHVCVILEDRNTKCLGLEGYERTSIPPVVSTNLLSISLGNWHSCAIGVDGILDCWLTHGFGRRTIALPTGLSSIRWAAVSVNSQRTCAVTVTGRGHCWAYPVYTDFSLPAHLSAECWAYLAVGPTHACGIDCRGQLQCWGSNEGGQSSPPVLYDTNYWVDVAVGKHHTCGVISNGTAVCFGHNQWQQSTPPFNAAGWQAIACGDSQTCAIDGNGAILCWGGAGSDKSFATPPTSISGYIGLSCQGVTCCAVDRLGNPGCWGRAHVVFPKIEPRSWPVTARTSKYACSVTFYGFGDCWTVDTGGGTATTFARGDLWKQLAPGESHTCGILLEDSKASCTSSSIAAALTTTYVRLASGLDFTCGLTTSFSLQCSGTTTPTFPLVAGEVLMDIESWDELLCGISSLGKLYCADFASTPIVFSPAPSELFVGVVVGDAVVCTLTTVNTIYCWDISIFTSPSSMHVPQLTGEVWAAVSAASVDEVCGLTSSGSVRCFGGTVTHNDPTALFLVPVIALVAGTFPCGVAQNGFITCWADSGTMETRQRSLDTGKVSVAAGSNFVCTLHFDGLVTCIGDIVPPPSTATFSSICAGPTYGCGINSNQKVQCWGDTTGLSIPSTTFNYRKVACGSGILCAIRYISVDGALISKDVTCSGLALSSTQLTSSCSRPDFLSFGSSGTSIEPDFYTDIAVGKDYMCAVRICGPVRCWGSVPSAPAPGSTYDVSQPQSTTQYTSLGAAPTSDRVCGMLKDEGVPVTACWGDREQTFQVFGGSEPDVDSYTIPTYYASVKGYTFHKYCGFTGSVIRCGSLLEAPAIEEEFALTSGTYKAFDVVYYNSNRLLCALDGMVQLTCWSPVFSIPAPFMAATGCIPKLLPNLFLPFSNIKASLPTTLSRLSLLSTLQLNQNGITGMCRCLCSLHHCTKVATVLLDHCQVMLRMLFQALP